MRQQKAREDRRRLEGADRRLLETDEHAAPRIGVVAAALEQLVRPGELAGQRLDRRVADLGEPRVRPQGTPQRRQVVVPAQRAPEGVPRLRVGDVARPRLEIDHAAPRGQRARRRQQLRELALHGPELAEEGEEVLVGLESVDRGIVRHVVPHRPPPLELAMQRDVLQRLGHGTSPAAARGRQQGPDHVRVHRQAQAVGGRQPDEVGRPHAAGQVVVEVAAQGHAREELLEGGRLVPNALEVHRGGRFPVAGGLGATHPRREVACGQGGQQEDAVRCGLVLHHLLSDSTRPSASRHRRSYRASRLVQPARPQRGARRSSSTPVCTGPFRSPPVTNGAGGRRRADGPRLSPPAGPIPGTPGPRDAAGPRRW